MPIRENFRQFGGFWPLKLCCHWFNPQTMQFPQRHSLRDNARQNRFIGVFCRLVQRNHYVYKKKKKLLGERWNVIFHPYGEKPQVVRLLPNVCCGWPSPTKSIVPNFIFITLIVFGWPCLKYWVFPLTWGVTFKQLELY